MGYEEIKDKLGNIINSLLNGDYCKRCWKFYFCRQVPFSYKIFKPCKAFIELQGDLFEIIDIINEEEE